MRLYPTSELWPANEILIQLTNCRGLFLLQRLKHKVNRVLKLVVVLAHFYSVYKLAGEAFCIGQNHIVFRLGVDVWLKILFCAPSGAAVFNILAKLFAFILLLYTTAQMIPAPTAPISRSKGTNDGKRLAIAALNVFMLPMILGDCVFFGVALFESFTLIDNDALALLIFVVSGRRKLYPAVRNGVLRKSEKYI